jgi:hypothetical protein
MSKYLVEFHKGNITPGNQESEFHGRLVIESDSEKSALKEFLEWLQERPEFESVTAFSFRAEKLEIVSGEDSIEY